MTVVLASIIAPLALSAFLFYEAIQSKINWPLLVLAQLFAILGVTILWINSSSFPGISNLMELVFSLLVQYFLYFTLAISLVFVVFEGVMYLQSLGQKLDLKK